MAEGGQQFEKMGDKEPPSLAEMMAEMEEDGTAEQMVAEAGAAEAFLEGSGTELALEDDKDKPTGQGTKATFAIDDSSGTGGMMHQTSSAGDATKGSGNTRSEGTANKQGFTFG